MDNNASAFPPLIEWTTSPAYASGDQNLTQTKFLEVTNLLLENPNLNSSHLFRADILFDSEGILKTVAEKECSCCGDKLTRNTASSIHCVDHGTTSYPRIQGHNTSRIIIRELIPRNLTIDRPIRQLCLVYNPSPSSCIVILIPDVQDTAEIPWYHPAVKALAYVFECANSGDPCNTTQARVSLHFLPFDKHDTVPGRLNRTFISLLNTFLRLCKHPSSSTLSDSGNAQRIASSTAPSSIKDTIIPQHLVQNTYSRLKQTYATNLIDQWIESTEPSKHVFEDLSIAAFLIELWKQLYHSQPFPGFVDLACGNGVLVYILLKEGYHGFGFDARRRKTWDILGIDDYLEERICVPKPFLDILQLSEASQLSELRIHDGLFPEGTFIISNHADELTPWTPLLAALSKPASTLPFLAIPCCSHALSGAKYRYTLKDTRASTNSAPNSPDPVETENQPSSGDLKALRKAKQNAANHTDDKSMYACLTRKVVRLAEEVGFEREGDVKMTLMRIPSTRNIGVVGGMRRWMGTHVNGARGSGRQEGCEIDEVAQELGRVVVEEHGAEAGWELENGDPQVLEALEQQVQKVIERECARAGGIEAAARIWVDKAIGLQKGRGRGKLNLGHKPQKP